MVKEKKYIAATFALIDAINQEHQFVVSVGRTQNHVYNGRTLTFNSDLDGGYGFVIRTKISAGVQTDKELDVRRTTEIKLSSEKLTLFTSGRRFLVSGISYPDLDSDVMEKEISGEINSISNRQKSFYNKERCYRIILPISKKVRLGGDFTGWSYSVDGSSIMETLINLQISGRTYHFFCIQWKGNYYFVIDGLNRQSLEKFQSTANSILLAYAFLKGDYHGKKAYILTYKTSRFETPVSILTEVLGGGIYKGFPVHSTKPHSILMRSRTRYKRNSQGTIIGINDASWKKYMVEFPSEALSKLCELISEKSGVLRAVILFVSNHTATLEMKVPTLFVALENVTKVLIGADVDTPTIIEDDKIIRRIDDIADNAKKELKKVEKEHSPQGADKADRDEYSANFSRINGKLSTLNRGTNNKKLVEPFGRYGYKLSEEEEELIFKHRNKFLHGDDFISFNESYDYEFKELFHLSMRLHKLIAVLLLKASGFSGYILNNASMYQYISEKKLKEPIFEKI